MTKSADKELYGLIGYPVKHSFSAFMHNAAFAHYHMNAEYHLFEVPPQELGDFFKKTIPAKNIRGFNITVPHKEAAVRYLNGVCSDGVNINGAVNTVRVEKDGKLSGFNTDGPGFSQDLKEHNILIKGQRVALLGAGGGAKSVATALAANTPAEILIFDMDKKKTEKLLGNIKTFYPDIRAKGVSSIEALNIKEADILINATPVGMKPQDPLLVKKEELHPKLFVYDLIYNPAQTKLLKTAQRNGCRWANGSGMLLYQGALAFEHWTAQEAPVEVMRQALKERLHV